MGPPPSTHPDPKGPPHAAGGPSFVARHVAPVLLAVTAATARLAYWFSMRDEPLVSDAGTYHELAVNLVRGDGFGHPFPQLDLHPTAFRPPLYPVVLSLVYRVFGADQGVGRAFGVVIGVAVVLATFAVVRRHASARAGFAAALAVALYPPLVVNDTLTLTEGLSLLLVLVLVDATLRRRWLTAGLWCGLLTLARPSAQFLVLVIALWLLVKVGWRPAALAVVVAAVVVTPWVVRNQVVVGEPVVVSSNGFNLAAMYSESAQRQGTFIDPVFDPSFDDLRLDQFDEATWDRKLRARAVANLRAHPLQVANVMGRNAVAMFEIRPSFNDTAERLDGRNPTVRTWTMPLFYVVTVAGVVGLIRARRSALAALAGFVALYFAVGSLFLVAPPRLRAPVDLLLCVGAGLLVAGFRSEPTDAVCIDLRAEPEDSDVAGERQRGVPVLHDVADM